MKTTIKFASDIIKNSDAILITSGAGIGVDSGLPDFRGTEGFWRAYPPIKKLGIGFEEMANPSWFEKKPKLAWAFYGHRLNLYRKIIPHNGFNILLNIAKKLNDNYFVVTSNVDGQFQKAGFEQEKIEEIHGSIHHLQCVNSCKRDIWSADEVVLKIDMEKFEAIGNLPKCIHCNGLARPNILMFGDFNWIPDRTNSQRQKFYSWLDKNLKNNVKLAVIEIGAGVAVPSIRHLSHRIVRNYDAKLIRINPRNANIPEGHISIPLNSLEALTAINELL